MGGWDLGGSGLAGACLGASGWAAWGALGGVAPPPLMWAKALAKASWSSLSPAFGGRAGLDAPEVLAEAVALALEAGRFPRGAGTHAGHHRQTALGSVQGGQLAQPVKEIPLQGGPLLRGVQEEGVVSPMEGELAHIAVKGSAVLQVHRLIGAVLAWRG